MIQSPQQPSTPRQTEQQFNFSCSSSVRTSTSSRLSGAELIRQLSYQKLNRSDDSLYNVSNAAVRQHHGRPAPIVKRFSDNYADRAQATRATQRQMRAKLIRQSTTAAADAAVASTAGTRRRQMAASRDQRSWRSCDVDQSVAVVMPRKTGRDLSPAVAARSMSGSIGRCDRINRQASCSTPQPSSFVDLTLSSGSLQVSAETTPRKTLDASPENRADDGHPPSGLVRYTKAKSPGEEDRIVLPPLIGPGVNASKALPAQVARAAGNTTKRVLRAGNKPVPRRQSTRRIVDRSSSVRRADVEAGGASGKKSEAEEALRLQRRRARGIVILTSVVLLFICLFMVGFTLHLAPLIDNLGKKLPRAALEGWTMAQSITLPEALCDNLDAQHPSHQRDDPFAR